jgi:hypothetical protein
MIFPAFVVAVFSAGRERKKTENRMANGAFTLAITHKEHPAAGQLYLETISQCF